MFKIEDENLFNNEIKKLFHKETDKSMQLLDFCWLKDEEANDCMKSADISYSYRVVLNRIRSETSKK